MSDAIGSAVLAVEATALTLALHWSIWSGILVFLVLIFMGFLSWYSEKSPTAAKGWGKLALGSIVVGTLFFGCDIGIGMINNQGVSPLEAGAHAGSPFGFGLTLLVCPGITAVAVAGFVRAAYQAKGR